MGQIDATINLQLLAPPRGGPTKTPLYQSSGVIRKKKKKSTFRRLSFHIRVTLTARVLKDLCLYFVLEHTEKLYLFTVSVVLFITGTEVCVPYIFIL